MSTTSSGGTSSGSGTSGHDAEADYETVARSTANSYWSGGGPGGASSGSGSPDSDANGYTTPSYAASDYVGNGEANLSRGAITSRTPPAQSAAAPASTVSSPAVEDDYASTAAFSTSTLTSPANASAGAAGMSGAAAAGGSAAGGPSAQQPRTGSTGATGAQSALHAKAKGPRRVRLAIARVDPWSVMKMSFLLSVALGIAGVILTAVLWMILSTMNVFTDIEGVLQSLQTSTTDPFSIRDYVGFGRVVSLSIVIGVIDVILLTAVATVMAFLYNICSALVGGIQLTLTDD